MIKPDEDVLKLELESANEDPRNGLSTQSKLLVT